MTSLKNVNAKEELLMSSLTKFFTKESNIDHMLPIVNGNSKISLRIIDWFVTNFAKKNNTSYVVSERQNKQFIVHLNYKSQLKAYSKKQFDPFCRRNRIEFYFNEEESITTTVGQLNFFRWAIQNNIINYILDNYKEIETDMNTNTRKKNDIIDLETLDLKNSKVEENIKKKVRKKRKPLSVSASKNMNKNSYPVLLNFD